MHKQTDNMSGSDKCYEEKLSQVGTSMTDLTTLVGEPQGSG